MEVTSKSYMKPACVNPNLYEKCSLCRPTGCRHFIFGGGYLIRVHILAIGCLLLLRYKSTSRCLICMFALVFVVITRHYCSVQWLYTASLKIANFPLGRLQPTLIFFSAPCKYRLSYCINENVSLYVINCTLCLHHNVAAVFCKHGIQ